MNPNINDFKEKIYNGKKNFVIVDCNYILNKTILKLEQDKYLKEKEYPDPDKILILIESIENDIKILQEYLIALYNLGDDNYESYIFDVFDKILNVKKNNESEYGYIWRQLNYYPALINFYSLGITYLDKKKYKHLKEIMFHPIINTYYDGSFVQKYKVSLLEKINSYHLFNFIEGLSVHLSDYFPLKVGIQSYEKNLYINNRIFNFLKEKFDVYLLSFNNTFDVFEYTLGIVNMDIRLNENNIIKFAPFGKNYRRNIKHNISFEDNYVFNYMDKNKSKLLEAGFFDGDLERYNNAVKEYNDLMIRISRM